MINHPITHQQVKELMYYDRKTGKMFWRHRTDKYIKRDCSRKSWNTKYAGNEIKSIDGKGYYFASIFGKQYGLHRLVWFYVYGKWPKIIDHINHDKLDNKLCNLRSVTVQQNNMNRRISANNTSGVFGVYLNKKKNLWCAQMKFNGKTYHLGSSKNKDEAIKLRKAEEQRLGFHKNHGGEYAK